MGGAAESSPCFAYTFVTDCWLGSCSNIIYLNLGRTSNNLEVVPQVEALGFQFGKDAGPVLRDHGGVVIGFIVGSEFVRAAPVFGGFGRGEIQLLPGG